MRTAKSRYESAKRKIEELKEELKSYQKTVRKWEEDIQKVGDVGAVNEIVALNEDENGEVWAEIRRIKKPVVKSQVA